MGACCTARDLLECALEMEALASTIFFFLVALYFYLPGPAWTGMISDNLHLQYKHCSPHPVIPLWTQPVQHPCPSLSHSLATHHHTTASSHLQMAPGTPPKKHATPQVLKVPRDGTRAPPKYPYHGWPALYTRIQQS